MTTQNCVNYVKAMARVYFQSPSMSRGSLIGRGQFPGSARGPHYLLRRGFVRVASAVTVHQIAAVI